VRDRGEALGHVVTQIEAFIRHPQARRELIDARRKLATALAEVQAIIAVLTGHFAKSRTEPREVYRVGLGSVALLLAVGDLLIGWLLLQHAEISLRALDSGVSDADRAFYDGKVAAARFFANNVLPRLSADRKVIEGADLAVMDMREEAF
jgi:hypothetical protein